MSALIESKTASNQPLDEVIRRGIIAAIARFLLCMLLVFVFAVVQGCRFGFLQEDYRLLALGSVVSTICGFAYAAVGTARANARHEHFWMFVAISSGWIPYFFTLYLIGYRGLWRLVQVFRDFSALSLLSSIVFRYRRVACRSLLASDHGFHTQCSTVSTGLTMRCSEPANRPYASFSVMRTLFLTRAVADLVPR